MVLTGSTLALIMYITWNAMILGNVLGRSTDKRGTGNRQYWWEQPMDLEAARASAVVAVPED